MNRGKLIVFEGIDGTGKSTQVNHLATYLRASGHTVVTSYEPTNGEHGQRLRQSMTEGRLSPQEELDLFIADRRDHVENLINPALARGEFVILDRYYFSTMAYQGARGFDVAEIRANNESFAPKPDLLIICELSVDGALDRIGARDGEGNAFEKRSCLEKCAAIFSTIDEPWVARIDASSTPDTIAREVAGIVDRSLINVAS